MIDDYTGFELLPPDTSRRCRVIRDRRYRPARTKREKKVPRFSGETRTIEIINEFVETPPSEPAETASIAVVFDVTISGGERPKSSTRHYGHLKRVGWGGSPFFCPLGAGRFLGSIRGGASPEEEEDTDAENMKDQAPTGAPCTESSSGGSSGVSSGLSGWSDGIQEGLPPADGALPPEFMFDPNAPNELEFSIQASVEKVCLCDILFHFAFHPSFLLSQCTVY